jgi:hypothetical protein
MGAMLPLRRTHCNIAFAVAVRLAPDREGSQVRRPELFKLEGDLRDDILV